MLWRSRLTGSAWTGERGRDRVARQGDQSIAAVARNFGISESCLSRWLKIADCEDGITPDTPAAPASAGEGDLETENR
jgi:transposase-like protein